MSILPYRHNQKWSSTEINRLYNEYELKKLNIEEIAKMHHRTVGAIMNKLQEEELIDEAWSNVHGWKGINKEIELNKDESDIDSDKENNSETDSSEDDSESESDEEYKSESDTDSNSDNDNFDPYSIKQKLNFIQKQLVNILNFLQTIFPNKKDLQLVN